MEIDELRSEINDIDDQLLQLFERRMDICRDIARYKVKNNLPVYQSNREQEILNKVRASSSSYLADASVILFSSIMDIGKVVQGEEFSKGHIYKGPALFEPENAQVIACQGTGGAYSEAACIKQFGADKSIRFTTNFADVVHLVEQGRADFGILPLENSNVGTIEETYRLLAETEMYINSVIRVEITHCLAAKKSTSPENIVKVYSKKEALDQCSMLIRNRGLERVEFANTALAAEMVAESADDTIACICSLECAQRLGLEVIEEKASDVYPNFTRFICFSKNFAAPTGADTMSVSFSTPHTPGGLYRTLTKFAVNGFNLTKIVSMPIAGQDFDVTFFLDFTASYSNRKVAAFIDDMRAGMKYFRFLGNFKEI
ncbi:MAG: chorismate mutase [Oscillospiraceae bacterium]|nr:chorismate mutase [Oscillospiraceae bacterium]